MKLLIKGLRGGRRTPAKTVARPRPSKTASTGIIVSETTGGRAEERRAAAQSNVCPEVLEGAGRTHLPVLIDGGFPARDRYFKALALGARRRLHRPPPHLGISRVRSHRRRKVLDLLRSLAEVSNEAMTARNHSPKSIAGWSSRHRHSAPGSCAPDGQGAVTASFFFFFTQELSSNPLPLLACSPLSTGYSLCQSQLPLTSGTS